jgi:hypothetical protein
MSSPFSYPAKSASISYAYCPPPLGGKSPGFSPCPNPLRNRERASGGLSERHYLALWVKATVARISVLIGPGLPYPTGLSRRTPIRGPKTPLLGPTPAGSLPRQAPQRRHARGGTRRGSPRSHAPLPRRHEHVAPAGAPLWQPAPQRTGTSTKQRGPQHGPPTCTTSHHSYGRMGHEDSMVILAWRLRQPGPQGPDLPQAAAAAC